MLLRQNSDIASHLPLFFDSHFFDSLLAAALLLPPRAAPAARAFGRCWPDCCGAPCQRPEAQAVLKMAQLLGVVTMALVSAGAPAAAPAAAGRPPGR